MIGRILRLIFDTVAGQVIVLVILSIVAMHAVLTGYFFLEASRNNFRPVSPAENVGRLASYASLYSRASPDQRGSLLALIDQANLPVDVVSQLPGGLARLTVSPLADALASTAKVFKPAEDIGNPQREVSGSVYMQLADGTILHADLPVEDFPGFLGPMSSTLGFLIIATVLLSGWAIIVITGPLRRFAAAVESFRDIHADVDIAERGPLEIRAAVAAFNRMRTRIVKLVDDRTNMLAAVSHDLRTPITRLRLRAEFIEDGQVRSAMLADLDHMAALAQAALTHLSGNEGHVPFETVDLPSLLQTIADQFSDIGHDVTYVGPDHVTASVRLNDMQRAVSNLVDNGIRYGKKVEIDLAVISPERLTVIVSDDGPGIPPADRERLLEPFARGDSARAKLPNSGFGLGLTIARDVAEAHGGALRLEVSPKLGGLEATIEIARRH